ncbi:hypothetical protein FRC11_013340, partial [Ceratobasidium sp. 423]
QNVLEATKKLSIPRKEVHSQLFRLASVLLQIIYLTLWLLWLEKVFSDPLHFGLNGTNDQCSPNESVVIWSVTYLEGAAESKLVSQAFQMEVSLAVIFGLLVLLNLAWVVYDMLVVYNIISPLSIFPKEPPCENKNGKEFVFRFWFTIIKLDNSGGGAFSAKQKAVFKLIMVSVLLLSNIFWIVAVEDTIRANNVQGDSHRWTYGQITALAVTIGQAIVSLSQLREGKKSTGDETTGDYRVQEESGEGYDAK